jgi:hypothetical protein
MLPEAEDMLQRSERLFPAISGRRIVKYLVDFSSVVYSILSISGLYPFATQSGLRAYTNFTFQ